jgi:hypothetical protein
MKITAIIVNYGRASDTLSCVQSLRLDAPHVRTIVVDNASPEADVEKLQAGLPEDATLLRSDQNLGYAGGNNLGIRLAMRDDPGAILILNNDILVQPGCVAALTDALARHHEWGVVGPLSLMADEPSKVDFFAAEVDLPHVAIKAHGRDGVLAALTQGEHETDYVTGSAMLVRHGALEAAGYFDERFFLVWEDVDLCLRIRQSGFRCGVTTSARVLHARSMSFGGDGTPLHRYYFVRNSFLIVRKHLSGAKKVKAQALAYRRYAQWSKGSTTMHAAIRAGLRDGFRGRWGPAPASVHAPLAP